MDKPFVFGIVGGAGWSGRAVLAELVQSTDQAILIGGRDAGKLETAAGCHPGRVSAACMDARDAGSVDEFCGRCSVIVNCAGPVSELEDRVAQAAFRARCHYVDPAGMSVVKERMLVRRRELEDAGLRFVISAGWTPGVSEAVPAYAAMRSAEVMDRVDSLHVWFTDSGEWADSALLDAFRYLRRMGLTRPHYFRKGQRARAAMRDASREFDLGDPIGRRRFSLVSLAEMDELGTRQTCDFFPYSYLAGARNAAAATAVMLLPLSDRLGVRLMRGMFRRNRLAVGGFVVARARGIRQGGVAELEVRAWFDNGQDYWMNGLALATTARLIAGGRGVRPGAHFLFEAVGPEAFLSEMQARGARIAESGC